ncbi:SpoIIE family protein phosphatase [Streptomyces monashensis]|uniref:SpoIIE family protein phosphatase n=1 Tax=Streptomyces monashensis TaxID=1678012 RepID=UPI0033FCE848
MAVQKYDIPVPGRPGGFEERWWSPINAPVLGPDGQVVWIIHRVEDVTEFVLSHPTRPETAGALGEREAMEAELYARARDLQRLNEELRQAHARERQVAVTLQEAMLQSPDLARHRDVAVRYLPAAGSLNVCGDWYDVVDLPDDGLFAVAVGDVDTRRGAGPVLPEQGTGVRSPWGWCRCTLEVQQRRNRRAGGVHAGPDRRLPGGFLAMQHYTSDFAEARRSPEGDGGTRPAAGSHRLVPIATALLDDTGRILHWSEAAEALVGYSTREAVGSYAGDLLMVEGRGHEALTLCDRVVSGRGWAGVFPVRRRDGTTVDLQFRTYPITGPDGRLYVLATAAEDKALRRVEENLAVLDGFFHQSPIGLAVYDTELRFVRINRALARINGLSPEQHIGRRITEVLPDINAAEMEEVMSHVLATGDPVVDARSHGHTQADPHRDRAWSASYFRLEAPSGQVLGVSSSVIDITERYHAEARASLAQERFALLAETGSRVGSTLDLRRAASELAEAMVPRFADVCGVHILERLVAGLDPRSDDPSEPVLVRRLALAAANESFPREELPLETVNRVDPDSPYARAMETGRTVTVRGRDLPLLAGRTDRLRAYLAAREVRTMRITPLVARSTVLGVVVYSRGQGREPFDDKDGTFGDELVSRAAVFIDHARLYLREHENLIERQNALREANAAREQLALLNEAGSRIGTTLDLERTAEELVEVVVPRFADFATVDLLDSVLRGEEPHELRTDEPVVMCAVAVSGAESLGSAGAADAVGESSRFDSAKVYSRSLRSGEAILVPEVDEEALAAVVATPDRVAPALAAGIHSYLMVPVLARGRILGGAEFMRIGDSPPFTTDDVWLAEELVARAAVSIDNARLYRQERETALTLQRSLLPQEIHHTLGLEIAYRYLPSSVAGEVGGDWFDVVPLSCGRVALVVGDVMGHGVKAAATMGQLRTVARTLATLEMQPDQVLTRLDETASGLGEGQFATCVCAVYDPVDRSCAMSCAGHLPPVVVDPDGTAKPVELPPGVPLGVGGVAFDSIETTIPEGGVLALYTDGLIERRGHDIDEGLDILCSTLAVRRRGLEETCDAVLAHLVTDGSEDDIAVIMARALPVPESTIVTLPLSEDVTLAGEARNFTRSTLESWSLAGLSEITELLVSELVTNALRHAGPPRQLRLFRDRSLTVEVADTGTQIPQLRPIDENIESGRGMHLVNELAHRWGSRTTRHGKVVWFELELPLGAGAAD